MLPTFVIGLREGLEAALIVGIIAAFLRQQGRKDLLRSVFLGVGIAVAICVVVGVGLKLLSHELPQRQQEGMETVIGILAVGMVSYMVVWMRRHSRELKGQLESLASDAISGASRAGRAMVAMAFLAVLREGIETVVFLLATFNESHAGAAGPAGVVLGLGLAVALGYGIYRGGIRLNLSKFFRATGLVLVLVAAGLVVNALHTAHEAGWLNIGQASTLDLSWLVRPGSVQASLLTGMLGVQQHPVVIEAVGWLVYLIPVGLYVAWPPGLTLARRTTSRVLIAIGVACALGTAVLVVARPAAPQRPPSRVAAASAVASAARGQVMVSDAGRRTQLTHSASTSSHGVRLELWTARSTVVDPAPHTMTLTGVAALNGGRLPIGTRSSGATVATVRYTTVTDYRVLAEPRTGRLVSLSIARGTRAELVEGDRLLPLASPAAQAQRSTADVEVASALGAARRDVQALGERSAMTGFAWLSGALAVLCLLGAGLARRGLARELG